MIIAICAAAAIVVMAVIVWQAVRSGGAETYSNGSATIELLANGSFKASLYHNESHQGSYTKQADGGNVTVIFVTDDGQTCIGTIENNALSIPREWRDSHGHGSVLPRK